MTFPKLKVRQLTLFISLISLLSGLGYRGHKNALLRQNFYNVEVCLSGCRAFAVDNGGKFPNRLFDLYPKYVHDPRFFVYRDQSGFEKKLKYSSGLFDDDASFAPLITAYGRGGEKIVGHIESYKTKNRKH